jgi:hypothetical protein
MLPQHNHTGDRCERCFLRKRAAPLAHMYHIQVFGSSMMHTPPAVDAVCTRLVHCLLLSSPQARLQVADAAVAAGNR